MFWSVMFPVSGTTGFSVLNRRVSFWPLCMVMHVIFVNALIAFLMLRFDGYSCITSERSKRILLSLHYFIGIHLTVWLVCLNVSILISINFDCLPFLTPFKIPGPKCDRHVGNDGYSIVAPRLQTANRYLRKDMTWRIKYAHQQWNEGRRHSHLKCSYLFLRVL